MTKDARKRYNNTADLLYDLEAVARGEPPMHARQKFDLAALSVLDSPEEDTTAIPVEIGSSLPMAEQPIFWSAVAGWAVAGILLVILVLMMSLFS